MLIGVALFALALANVVGQTANDPVNTYLPFVNLGAIGVFCYLFFTGKIVGWKVYERAIQDRDRDHGELVALRSKLEDQMIPGFVRMTDLTAKLLDRERDQGRS